MAITAQTGKQALLDLVNKDNSTAFTLAQVALAAPAVVAEPVAGRNSTVKITGVDAVALPGEVDVTYTRQPGSAVFAGVPNHEFSKDAAVAADVTAEIVANVLPGLSVPLEDGSYDITAVALDSSDPSSEDGKYNWTVTIDLAKNYILVGTVTILVNSNKVSLSDIQTTELSGFTAEDVAE